MTEICRVSKEQYKIIQNSDKGVKEVLYSYRFNNKYIHRFFVFSKEVAKDDNYYIEKTKKIIANEKENGKFAKYSIKYLEDLKIVRRKKIALACVIPAAVVGIAIGGVFLTRYFVNRPLPEVGEEVAVEVSTKIISNQMDVMEPLLDYTKVGSCVMSSTITSYKTGTNSFSHYIDFDFSGDEFYFKDEYRENEKLLLTDYYLYRKAGRDAETLPSGIYHFYKDENQTDPDGTGNYVYSSASSAEAKTYFSNKILGELEFLDYHYDAIMFGKPTLLETLYLDYTKIQVTESQKQHSDAYISTNFRSDRKNSLISKLDYLYYINDERYYSNVNGTVINNLCRDCSIVYEQGPQADRNDASYKLINSKITKDEGYNNWKREGE